MENTWLARMKLLLNKEILLIAGIIFVAFNLRPSITAVGPLVSSIRSDLHISNGQVGFLTTLPLLAFAFLSPIVPKLGHRFTHERTVFIGLSILCLGIFVRSTNLVVTLFVGTALLGIGIAICNVLLPSIVKQKFPRKVGLMTGVYTTSMGIWAAFASGISIPIASGMGFGWQKSLLVWGVLAFLALCFWFPQVLVKTQPENIPEIGQQKLSFFRSPIAWQVTCFMGFNSTLFYCMVAWLPEILVSQGLDVSTAGWMLSLMQFIGLPATFITPVLSDRFSDQKGIALAIGFFYFIGLIGLFLSNNIVILTMVIIFLGIAQGAGISLALTLISLRAANAKQAANLSGMAQSFGYSFAALGPIGIGFLFDLFHTWSISLLLMVSVSLLLMVAGYGAGRNQYVFHTEAFAEVSK